MRWKCFADTGGVLSNLMYAGGADRGAPAGDQLGRQQSGHLGCAADGQGRQASLLSLALPHLPISLLCT